MPYSDVPANHWAKADIEAAAQWGLLKGYPDGTFGPDKPITRAEFAAVLRRLLEADPENRIILEAMPSLVYVVSDFGGTRSVGSGAFVAPWKVLTNAHVVSRQDGSRAVNVEVWGNKAYGYSPLDPLVARIEAIRHEVDLALLEVQRPWYQVECKPIALADKEPDVGDWVWALGNPFGHAWDVTRGTIRHKARSIKYWTHPQLLWATDAPINTGNSGGILIDVRGRMCGVPCAGISGANSYCYAIPLPQVRAFLEAAGI